MPRKSADAIAGAYFRTGGVAPAPPKHLDATSKRLWREITHSRPPDFFTAGSLPLLEAYVQGLMMHRFYTKMWHDDPVNRDRFARSIVALNNSLTQLATKLRLAITSIDKKSGILNETGDLPENVTKFEKRKRAVLFGGTEAKW